MKDNIRELLNELYPVDIVQVLPVTDEMYRCEGKEGTYYARITNYKTYQEQLEEIRWTDYLHQQGLSVSPTIASRNGKPIEQIKLDGVKLVVLYEAAPGVHPPKSLWKASLLKELGRQIGKLHRLSKAYQKEEKVVHIKEWHQNEEYNFLKYIPKEQTKIRRIAEEVLIAVKNLPKNDTAYGLIHGDLWLENILVDPLSKLTMVDFQDCEKHYLMFDLAVPIYSAVEYSFDGNGNITDYARSVTDAILNGYREEHHLSEEMLKTLPLLIKLKEIFEYSLMYMYWDPANLTEDQLRIMNHCRLRIEGNHGILEKEG